MSNRMNKEGFFFFAKRFGMCQNLYLAFSAALNFPKMAIFLARGSKSRHFKKHPNHSRITANHINIIRVVAKKVGGFFSSV